MKELSGPAGGDVIAHKYKSLDDVREPDSVCPVTMAAARGARAERPMVCTWEGDGVEVCFRPARSIGTFIRGSRP